MTGRTADGADRDGADRARGLAGRPIYGFDVTPARLVTGLITERGVLGRTAPRWPPPFPNGPRQRPNNEGREPMQSAWNDRDAEAAVARYASSAAIWRCGSIPRASWARTRAWCCTAAATRR